MSIIINNLQERQNIDTTNSIVSVVSFQNKWINSLHEGHVALVQHAKSISDIVFVNFFPVYPLADFLYGNETAFYRDSTSAGVPNQQYMIDWCELQGVDYIWFATEDYYIDWFSGYNINDLKTWVDDLCTKEGYIHSNVDVMRNIKRLLITLKPLVDNQYYHYDYRVSSWKDGVIRFFEKHFYEKYLGTTSIVLEPVKSVDGITFSSTYLLTDEINKIIQVENEIIKKSNISISSDIEKFKTDIANYTTSLSENEIDIKIENINIPNISKFLPLNKVLIETTVFIENKGRFFFNILK